tara:strand:+ start:449 stop:838 length:390 start_codon:yes stop_codon:yes gene_type:complete
MITEVIRMSVKDIFSDSIQIQIDAKKIGLDWLDIKGVMSKVFEETREVEEAISTGKSDLISEELGDLLFTYLSLVRHLNMNPTIILHDAKSKFEQRYKLIKNQLERENKMYAEPEEMSELWEKLKNKKI